MGLEASPTLISIMITAIVLVGMFVYLNKYSNKKSAILLGVGFMIIAVIIESIIQQIPFLIILFKSKMSLSVATNTYLSLEKKYVLFLSLYLGLVAAVSQESMKYLGVRYFYSKNESGYIGYGFSVVDLSIFIIQIIIAVPAFLIDKEIGILTLISVALQAPVSMFFHTGSALFLKDGTISGKIVRNFILTLFAHTYIDGSLDFSNISIILNHAPKIIGIYVTWIPSMILSLFYLAYLLKNMRK